MLSQQRFPFGWVGLQHRDEHLFDLLVALRIHHPILAGSWVVYGGRNSVRQAHGHAGSEPLDDSSSVRGPRAADVIGALGLRMALALFDAASHKHGQAG